MADLAFADTFQFFHHVLIDRARRDDNDHAFDFIHSDELVLVVHPLRKKIEDLRRHRELSGRQKRQMKMLNDRLRNRLFAHEAELYQRFA